MGPWDLYFLFFAVALIYSMVGFGGGSSYLALLALFGTEIFVMRSTSLLCNITVVLGNVWVFYKAGLLNIPKVVPLIVASMPMAFLGGYIPVDEELFKKILGATLLMAATMTWFSSTLSKLQIENKIQQRHGYLNNAIIGGGIGFLSGMVGIGGGIFLAPVLYLTKWDVPKVIAATSSFFILVNSLLGLAGQMFSPKFILDWAFALPLMLCVFTGGQIGVRLTARKLPAGLIQKATALLVCYVGLRLLFFN